MIPLANNHDLATIMVRHSATLNICERKRENTLASYSIMLCDVTSSLPAARFK